MERYNRQHAVVIIIILIIIAGILVPFVWPDTIANITKTVINSNYKLQNTGTNSVDTLLAIVLGIFTVSTAFYIFFLEISSQRHREYRRKELVGKAPDVILVLQIILFVAALFCFLSEKGKWLNWLLWLVFVFSLAMISIAVLCTTSCIDLCLIYRMKFILYKMKRNKVILIPYEKKIHEMMRKLAYDTGKQFTANVTQDLDQFQMIITNHIITTTRKLRSGQTICFLYVCFYQITLYLIRGFKESRHQRDEVNINLLVNMFIDFYSIIMAQLFRMMPDAKLTEDMEYEKLFSLAVLSGIVCCAIENLDNKESERLFARILNYRIENMNVFASNEEYSRLIQRLFAILYARGYYLVINNRTSETEKTDWFFNILCNSIDVLDDHAEDDVRLFWNFWIGLDKLSLRGSATYIGQLMRAMKEKYARRQQDYKKDLVYILLFGDKDKELMI